MVGVYMVYCMKTLFGRWASNLQGPWHHWQVCFINWLVMIWSGLHIHTQKLDGSWLVQIGWFNFFVNKLALYIHRCVIEALYVVLSINPNRPSIIGGTHVMIESTIMFWQFESSSLAINFVHWLMMKSHCSHWWIGFICWFIDSLIVWFIHSFIQSFIHWLIHALIHSFIPSFIHSFLPSFIN